MLSLWRRMPVILRALLIGSTALAAGTLPWAALVAANQRFLPSVPWSVLPAVFYLWLYWRYVRGEGWPRSTAEARRTNTRANHLSDDVWGAALLAGALGLGALMLMQNIMNRLVVLPQRQEDVSMFPFGTLFVLLVMGSVVAGVVEEAAFRGYMQGPIERRHGPVIAILVTGILFGFAHFTHPEVTLILMPFYLAVAAIYGTLAYLTNSILPSMVLHAGGNVFVGLIFFTTGRSEWQGSPIPAPLIWETGTDASFWITVVGFLIVGAAAVGAYAALASVARPHPGAELRLGDV
jgi:membrane protease YdiL (CAAX protease family)